MDMYFEGKTNAQEKMLTYDYIIIINICDIYITLHNYVCIYNN